MTVPTTVELPYIGGAHVAAHSQISQDAINPANGERIAAVVHCDDVGVDQAVSAADDAQQQWMSGMRLDACTSCCVGPNSSTPTSATWPESTPETWAGS